jgi:hypothetical protein
MDSMTEAQTATDTSLGFGVAEMAYLVQLQDTDESRASAAWLRLKEESENKQLVSAGLSSLIARRLAAVDGTNVEFDAKVDAVAYTLSHAAKWTQLDLLMDAQRADSVLHAEAGKISLIFQPRTMMSWFVLPQDAHFSKEAAEAFIVREHLLKYPEGGVKIRSGRVPSSQQLLIRKDTRGWAHTIAQGDVVGPEQLATTSEDLTAVLKAFGHEAGEN